MARSKVNCTALPSLSLARPKLPELITAERVVVDGRVEGPIQGGEVVLKSQADVVGDIQHQSLAIDSGAYFEGRSVQARGANGQQPERLGKKLPQELPTLPKQPEPFRRRLVSKVEGTLRRHY
jgi:hypothetical protein